MTDDADVRASYDSRVAALRGRRVESVDYWDIHNHAPDPAPWDYGTWHHAVMGVQLTTDSGPVTVTWTSTFYPYGVEVFPEPIAHHLVLGEDGPQRVGPSRESRWTTYLGQPIRDARISWETLSIGPARKWDGEIVAASYDVAVPTALRLDFEAGPVWVRRRDPAAPGDYCERLSRRTWLGRRRVGCRDAPPGLATPLDECPLIDGHAAFLSHPSPPYASIERTVIGMMRAPCGKRA